MKNVCAIASGIFFGTFAVMVFDSLAVQIGFIIASALVEMIVDIFLSSSPPNGGAR